MLRFLLSWLACLRVHWHRHNYFFNVVDYLVSCWLWLGTDCIRVVDMLHQHLKLIFLLGWNLSIFFDQIEELRVLVAEQLLEASIDPLSLFRVINWNGVFTCDVRDFILIAIWIAHFTVISLIAVEPSLLEVLVIRVRTFVILELSRSLPLLLLSLPFSFSQWAHWLVNSEATSNKVPVFFCLPASWSKPFNELWVTLISWLWQSDINFSDFHTELVICWMTPSITMLRWLFTMRSLTCWGVSWWSNAKLTVSLVKLILVFCYRASAISWASEWLHSFSLTF